MSYDEVRTLKETVLVKSEGLKKYFPLRGSLFSRAKAAVHAVDGVDLYIREGETLGLVGESGCGKTTFGLLILRLLKPTGGKVFFQGKNIFDLKKKEMMKVRRHMQIVFQDPLSSLNPRMTVSQIISEPMIVHGVYTRKERIEKVNELLEKVGLTKEHMKRYPHQFSGGQKQRIAIARALALNTKFIVLDEPTSALDVSVQAKILNLLRELENRLNFSYLFISHDLSVIRNVCEGTAVMYLGKIVELGKTEEIFRKPKHPYSQALISAVPSMNPRLRGILGRHILKGDVPSPVDLPSGCRFHPRCICAMSECKELEPKSIDVGNRHFVACHLYT